MTGLGLRTIRASAIAAVLLAGAGTVAAQESERGFGFLEQLFGGSDRVSPGQERGAAPDRNPAAGSDRLAQTAAPDLMVRIDRLEAQIRQLTGAIEQLQYRNQQLEGLVRRMQPDGDYRGQDGAAPRATTPTRPPPAQQPLAQQPPAQQPLAQQPLAQQPPAQQPLAQQPPAMLPPGTLPPGATPGRRGDAFDPTLNPNAPGAPRPLGTTTPSAPLTQDEQVGAPGGRAAGAPLDLSTLAGAPAADPSFSAGMAAPGGELPSPQSRNPSGTGGQVAALPPTDSPKDAYDLAYGYVLRKDYALAEQGFRSFLGRYPSDRLASDAQYWLGESLFQRQRYRDAAEAFLNVSTKYETAARAPDALLRLGQALAAMGEKEAACASFGEVLRKYPRASVSVKQGVDREQKRVRC